MAWVYILECRGGSSYVGSTVDLAARRVRLDGEDVRLTPIEYKLLSILVKNAGKVVTHAQLLREVWGKHSLDNNHYLRIHTQHLREKLKDDAVSGALRGAESKPAKDAMLHDWELYQARNEGTEPVLQFPGTGPHQPGK